MNYFWIFLFFEILITFFFFFQQRPSGFNISNPQFTMIASVFRYQVIEYFILAFLAFLFILESGFFKNKKQIVILFIIIILMFLQVINSPFGIKHFNSSIYDNNDFIDDFIQRFPPNEKTLLIINPYDDKLFGLDYNFIMKDFFNEKLFKKLIENNFIIISQKEICIKYSTNKDKCTQEWNILS